MKNKIFTIVLFFFLGCGKETFVMPQACEISFYHNQCDETYISCVTEISKMDQSIVDWKMVDPISGEFTVETYPACYGIIDERGIWIPIKLNAQGEENVFEFFNQDCAGFVLCFGKDKVVWPSGVEFE